MTVHGTGYERNEKVQITVVTTPRPGGLPGPEGVGGEDAALRPVARTQAEQTVHADHDGAFSAKVRLSELGLATITATGKRSGRSASVVVSVVPPACGMPPTGNSSGRLLWLGVAAVGGGALLLTGGVFWRRRRS